MMISRQKQREIIDALRRGTVPNQGLESFAVELDRFEPAIDSDLDLVKSGGSAFKAVRGEYGSGKTFFVRWLQERAKQRGFAAAEVQISETETPLHKLETIYRRFMERLSTGSSQPGAFREIIDAWFYTLEEDVLAAGDMDSLVETLQRVRGDVRDKGLNSLRQLIDEIDAGRFPGLYLVITGTPAFFDGPQGVKRLAPLAQRLHTDFSTDPKFDNPRAVQIRLKGFDLSALLRLGCKIRDIYATYSERGERIQSLANESYVELLARAVAGNLGGKVGIAPRLFLKKLVGDVLDRIDQFLDFDPKRDYALTFVDSEMGEVERSAFSAKDGMRSNFDYERF